ncbi:unnamed protein product [Notodromas monacha]|uniref:RHD domain-containing protein n=1 Tax=Notodromas monacha TaxID=399045 RepID=A0A7R9GKQ9_9CRUS|nr:unnamed protein product [Notodromas monacha]CAG0925063.1 unnamed protein product [Notodromas monacha]
MFRVAGKCEAFYKSADFFVNSIYVQEHVGDYNRVCLRGYSKPTTLQVFIGTDQGKVGPHMFYQACRVAGKNSTPCGETKIGGTVVLELTMEPSKEMTVSCDCVGILKERNVDVEQRFPDQASTSTKKRSTKCRLVFRAKLEHSGGFSEILQTVSQPISCTQPPGVPEILKKSLSSCSMEGGVELIILGKNFSKEAKVIFKTPGPEDDDSWEVEVSPQKEFLHQLHLLCIVPPFKDLDLNKKVEVELTIKCGGQSSDPHPFYFTPVLPSLESLKDSLPDEIIVGVTHQTSVDDISNHWDSEMKPLMCVNRVYENDSPREDISVHLEGDQKFFLTDVGTANHLMHDPEQGCFHENGNAISMQLQECSFTQFPAGQRPEGELMEVVSLVQPTAVPSESIVELSSGCQSSAPLCHIEYISPQLTLTENNDLDEQMCGMISEQPVALGSVRRFSDASSSTPCHKVILLSSDTVHVPPVFMTAGDAPVAVPSQLDILKDAEQLFTELAGHSGENGKDELPMLLASEVQFHAPTKCDAVCNPGTGVQTGNEIFRTGLDGF